MSKINFLTFNNKILILFEISDILIVTPFTKCKFPSHKAWALSLFFWYRGHRLNWCHFRSDDGKILFSVRNVGFVSVKYFSDLIYPFTTFIKILLQYLDNISKRH